MTWHTVHLNISLKMLIYNDNGAHFGQNFSRWSRTYLVVGIYGNTLIMNFGTMNHIN